MSQYQHWRGTPTEPGAEGSNRAIEPASVGLAAVVTLGVMGIVVLAPVQFLALPLNLSPMDILSLAVLPIFWVYIVRTHQPIRLPYVVAMYLIFLGSLLATFAAPYPAKSLIAILKEVGAYVWFITLAVVLSSFRPKRFHQVLIVWLLVVVLHGALIVAQFASPDFFKSMSAFVSGIGALDNWRPSGLFQNANGAALFQLAGFAPLLLVKPPRLVCMILGLFLLLTIITTGSLGALVGLAVGLAAGLVALPAIYGPRAAARILFQFAAVAMLLGGIAYFVLAQTPGVSARLQYVSSERMDKSASGRFNLWGRELGLLSSQMRVLGIGPDNYREMDPLLKQPHNDLLGFLVERGIVSTLGLMLLATTILGRAILLLVRHKRAAGPNGLPVIIILVVVVAALVDAQFHQVFHDRYVWLSLALMEAIAVGEMATIPALRAAAKQSGRVLLGGQVSTVPENLSGVQG